MYQHISQLNSTCSLITLCVFRGVALFFITSLLFSIPYLFESSSSAFGDTQSTIQSTPQKKSNTSPPPITPPRIDEIPLPKSRGFWGTFFFWSGGVFCMYLVGRHLFKEQSHERRTLKRFNEEFGPFFPEFDPTNLRKWIHIAAPHLYSSWRSGDFSGMESFTSQSFQDKERAAAQERKESGRIRNSYLGAVLNVHPLGAYLLDGETVPPKGVELILRIELKVIDFLVIEETGEEIGKKKRQQQQWIWTLRHTGKTWSLHDVYLASKDIQHLSECPPLPPIIEWRRPLESNS